MTQAVEHLVDALLAMKDAHAAKYHDETWTEQDAAAQEHAARAIAEYGADRERKIGVVAEPSIASGPRVENRLANALQRMLDSAKELASEAGDVDEWNEGGHAYEACQDARRTLAEFRAQSAPRDAKAPELLEVAKQALRFLEDSALTGGDLAPALQAAIARAGGQEAGEISRIPAYDRANPDGMRQWFEQMSQRGLLFHPEDSAETIIAPDGSKLFTDVESAQADAILKDMFDQHGNRVIDVCYPIFMGAGRVKDEPEHLQKYEARYVVEGAVYPDDPGGPLLHVDGLYPPFSVFNVDRQENLPGRYATRAEAETALGTLVFAELTTAKRQAATPDPALEEEHEGMTP